MGKHFVPQYYLKGFTEPNTEMLWVCPKDNSPQFKASTDNIAHQKRFYSHKTETFLTEVIEEKGNPVLDQIRQGRSINGSDKRALSEYLSALLKRGILEEERFKKEAPEIAERSGLALQEQFMAARQNDPVNASEYDYAISRVKVVVSKYKAQPPRSAWEAGFSPDKAPWLTDFFYSMKWIFLVYEGEAAFLTSDNPIFIPLEGLNKGKFEFSFPISSNVALWGTQRVDLREGYLKIGKDVVVELNRRTGATAVRHLFAGFEAKWICQITKRKFAPNLRIPKRSNRNISQSCNLTRNT